MALIIGSFAENQLILCQMDSPSNGGIHTELV